MKATRGSRGWLTGQEISRQVRLGRIVIEPFDTGLVNPNSYNYTLAPSIKRLTNDVIDLRGEDTWEELTIGAQGLCLRPGQCYLGCTNETFGSSWYASLITGRSSIGRKFITNHVTAGLVDVGFVGRITLEVVVMKPTIVYSGIPFGQIFWFSLAGRATRYKGKYQLQAEPTVSRIRMDKVSRR